MQAGSDGGDPKPKTKHHPHEIFHLQISLFGYPIYLSLPSINRGSESILHFLFDMSVVNPEPGTLVHVLAKCRDASGIEGALQDLLGSWRRIS